MREIILTRGVKERIQEKILDKIVEILASKEKNISEREIDYLQIFEPRGNKLINRQEVPETSQEFEIENCLLLKKVYAIKQDEDNKKYWVIMFPEEY